MKTKITESELKSSVSSLREYLASIESQQVNEEGVMNALGQLGGAVAGTAMNGVNAVGNGIAGAYDAAKAGVGKAVDAAGNAISGAVAPVVQGAKQGYAAATGAPAPTASQNVKPPRPGQAPAKSDPAVVKLQQALIAKGAKIKADGIMGPATRAAQAQFPNVTTQTDAEKAVAADINSADKAPAELKPAGPFTNPMAPAATNATANTTGGPANMGGVQAQGDDAGNTTITRPDGSTMVIGPDGKQVMPGSNPNLPQNKGVINTVKNAVQGTGDFQKPTGFVQPTVTNESVKVDELQRLVGLVHHR